MGTRLSFGNPCPNDATLAQCRRPRQVGLNLQTWYDLEQAQAANGIAAGRHPTVDVHQGWRAAMVRLRAVVPDRRHPVHQLQGERVELRFELARLEAQPAFAQASAELEGEAVAEVVLS